MAGPCDDLTVVDLTEGMAGSITTMVLADGGANVIKVEPPGGDRMRDEPAWIMWNRGKRSVVADVTSGSGNAVLEGLARDADVVVSSWTPRSRDALASHLAHLRVANPHLVTCSISGFGPLTAYSHLAGYEGVVKAKTGRGNVYVGQVDREGPVYEAPHTAEYGAAMCAIQGILAALHVRRTTGRGQHIETSLVQALFYYDWGFTPQPQPGGGTTAPPQPAPAVTMKPTPGYFVAPTADGHWLQMANSNRMLKSWIKAVGLELLLDDPRYRGRLETSSGSIPPGPELEALFAYFYTRMREKTRDEWMAVLSADLGVAVEPFLTTEQGMDHPHVVATKLVIDLDDPAVGPTRQLAPFAFMSDTPMQPQGPAPRLGEHTDEIVASIPARPRRPQKTGAPEPEYLLDDVTVLEFSTFVAGPLGPAILADLGARVIKVEPPGGVLMRPMFQRVLQGKESCEIDLKSREGQEIVRRLIPRVDILTHNFRPGVAERLGIGQDDARAANPRLIYHYAGSYGTNGPSSPRPAMHPIPGAVCGGAVFQAGAGMPPAPDRPLVWDEMRRVSGVLYKANEGNPDISAGIGVATALMLALHARDRTGRGQYVETTMLGSNFYVNADDAIQYEGKRARRLADPDGYGIGPRHRFYPAREGWVFLACVDEPEWAVFCRLVGRPDLEGRGAPDPHHANADADTKDADHDLVDELSRLFATRTAAEWEALLAREGVACVEARLPGAESFNISDPSMRASGMRVEVDHPDPVWGRYERSGPTVTFSHSHVRLGPGTVLGQDTQSILIELGYEAAEIAALRERQVVGGPS